MRRHPGFKHFKVMLMRFDKFFDAWEIYHNEYFGTWDYVRGQISHYESMGYTAFIEVH